jgi:hypothetical protein
LTGADEKVSLGSAPILLPIITAIIGMLLGAAGGRIARNMREREEGDPGEPRGAPS